MFLRNLCDYTTVSPLTRKLNSKVKRKRLQSHQKRNERVECVYETELTSRVRIERADIGTYLHETEPTNRLDEAHGRELGAYFLIG